MSDRKILIVLLMAGVLVAACDNKKSSKCDPGTEGCACREGTGCDEGLVCVEGICKGESSVGVSVSDKDARSCEVLLVEGVSKLVGVQFSEDVKGTYVSQSPKTALTFIALHDEPFAKSDIQVRVIDEKSDDIEVEKVSCFDKQGTKLEGTKISLE